MTKLNRFFLTLSASLMSVAGAIGGFVGSYDIKVPILVDAVGYDSSYGYTFQVDFINKPANFGEMLASDMVSVVEYYPNSSGRYVQLGSEHSFAVLGSVVCKGRYYSPDVVKWVWYVFDDDAYVALDTDWYQLLTRFTPAFCSQDFVRVSLGYFDYYAMDIYRYLSAASPQYVRAQGSPEVLQYNDLSFSDVLYATGSYDPTTFSMWFRSNDVSHGEQVLQDFLTASYDYANYAYSDGYRDGADIGVAGASVSIYNDGYQNGRSDGYQEGYWKGFEDGDSQQDVIGGLFGSIIDVPLQVLRGLTPLAIWDTPIIGIIMTFMFLGLMLWIVKRFI